MELNAEQIKKALECCSAIALCGDECPLYDVGCCVRQVTGNALALITSQEQRIKELEAKNRQYDYDQRKLIKAHDTYKEYAENMQLFVEKMVHLEDKGYEPSAARYAAEMDMWRAVALEKKRLTEENERLSYLEEKVICGYKEGYSKAVIAMREQSKSKAYTNNYCQEVVLLSDIYQIATEMLEGEK